ncbi:MAG: hypothetical protein ABJ084_14050 [Halioglobus sp.]
MSALPRYLYSLALLAMIFSATPTWSSDDFNIWAVPNINFGTWNDAGTLSTTTVGCIESWDKRKTKDYRLTLSSASSNSNFYLYRNGDTSQTGNNRIQVDISSRDIKSSPTYTLFLNDEATYKRKGQKQNCPDGDNGELKLTILQGELTSAIAGNYSASFTLSGMGGKGYRRSDSQNFQVFLSVENPQVQISGLDDINLTTDPLATGGIEVDENFCVYAASTDYRLTITSTQYSAGNFSLVSSQGDELPINLQFADNITGASMQNVQVASSMNGTGDNASSSCGGEDNATLRISVSESGLREASTGNYGASLTLLVEPI